MSGDSKVPYPKGIPLILTTEFCERFSYYGMRAILVLFCSNVILLSETNSSILFHGFTFLAYSTPIFGAILADSFIGLFMIKINHINKDIIQASTTLSSTCLCSTLWVKLLSCYPLWEWSTNQQRFCEYFSIISSSLILDIL